MSLLLAAAASALVPPQRALSWEGTAEVYAPGKVIKIAVRTRIDAHGHVIGESWPVDVGEAKGMHRMTLNRIGGTIDVGGKRTAMPSSMWAEESAQYAFYRQIQVASAKASGLARRGVRAFDVPGLVTTRFRIDRRGSLLGASNSVRVGEHGSLTPQAFRFDGFWRSHGAIFPRHMEMVRDGQRYFTLNVTRFDAR
jgi:hypothetical protein